MAKKLITKLFIFVLCAVFALPLSVLSFEVKASDTTKAYVGSEFSFTVSDEIKLLDKEVVITAKESADAEATVIFDGAIVGNLEKYSVTDYKAGVFKGRVKKAGDYTFTFTGKGDNSSKTFVKKVMAYSDINDAVFTEPKYSYSPIALEAYKKQVLDATYVDASAQDKVYLSLNKSYEVPSIESLIDTSFLSYSQYRRTVHYTAPHASNYTTSSPAQGSSAKLTISLSKIGTYRFYVTLTSDVIDGRTFSITTKGLKEYYDGFYAVQTKDTKIRLYVNGDKYYTSDEYTSESLYEFDENKEIEEQIEKVSETPIVPIFEFEIGNAGPSIDISNNPEKGYVDLEYTAGRITVSGHEVTTTYELQYSQTGEENSFTKAEEEYDSTTGKFVPNKIGYYRIKISVVDSENLTDTKYTKNIVVTEKYQTVNYVTGFGDWIKVNYVPFIFLCISGLCLVGIILLLVIKPKETVTAQEDDGIDE